MPVETSWNQRVWELVARIPYGRVAWYGQLAGILGHPRRARQVGFALHAAPSSLALPWHRVINARGMISFPSDSEQYHVQKALLTGEQIVFNEKDRIDLKAFGWMGPDQ